MESQKEKKLADILAGASDLVITGALSVLAIPDADESQLEKQLEQVRAEKLAVAPGCADCVAKCGNTDDYDMERDRQRWWPSHSHLPWQCP